MRGREQERNQNKDKEKEEGREEKQKGRKKRRTRHDFKKKGIRLPPQLLFILYILFMPRYACLNAPAFSLPSSVPSLKISHPLTLITVKTFYQALESTSTHLPG